MDLAAPTPCAVLGEVLGVSIGGHRLGRRHRRPPRAVAAELSRRPKSGDQGRVLAVPLSKDGDDGVSE
ncbi:hypothetical protein [Streptomyces canus]|uniref:Uncharacterized protein n=1 Tax=Streptomyces canus TaxID=58343 RepID=A0AAW8FUB2_9ACTN|nr:hypothetical protein [Streptomyces canus]MDQ0913636.1 hypothetical protein [Streptomyces canus]MDQ1073602.1 hypothetical protein [Streptomyces canus]